MGPWVFGSLAGHTSYNGNAHLYIISKCDIVQANVEMETNPGVGCG